MLGMRILFSATTQLPSRPAITQLSGELEGNTLIRCAHCCRMQSLGAGSLFGRPTATQLLRKLGNDRDEAHEEELMEFRHVDDEDYDDDDDHDSGYRDVCHGYQDSDHDADDDDTGP